LSTWPLIGGKVAAGGERKEREKKQSSLRQYHNHTNFGGGGGGGEEGGGRDKGGGRVAGVSTLLLIAPRRGKEGKGERMEKENYVRINFAIELPFLSTRERKRGERKKKK